MWTTQGLKVEVCPSLFEENLDKASFKHPYDYAKENAHQKTLSVAKSLADDPVRNYVIIEVNYFNLVAVVSR